MQNGSPVTDHGCSPNSSPNSSPNTAPIERGVWSKYEHDKFLEATRLYPNGPWKAIADHVGTRSVRQVQTHAQKYQEKVERRERGLQKNRQKVSRLEHRVDEASYDFVNRPRAANGRKRGSSNKHSSASTAKSTGPTIFSGMGTSPPDELLLEVVSLFDRDSTPRPNRLPSPMPFRQEMPSVTIERMENLSLEDPKAFEESKESKVTQEAAPPSVNGVAPHEIPSFNESLDYFLRILSVWGSGPMGGGIHGVRR